MRVRVVLVGIEGPVNLGVIARTCVNFGVDELYIVNPVASVEESLKYSAGGRDLLSRAIIVDSLDKALEGVELSVATSAVGHREGDMLRQAMPIEDFVKVIAPRTNYMALIFGRESTGLTREEIARADILVTIPGNPEYPVLNVSQAVAIFLWELWKLRGVRPANLPPRAGAEELSEILGTVNAISASIFSSPEKVGRAGILWRRILYRSRPSRYEAAFLKYWFNRVKRKLGVRATRA